MYGPTPLQTYCQCPINVLPVIPNNTVIPYDGPVTGTLTGYNNGTYTFTPPVGGFYYIDAQITVPLAPGTPGTYIELSVDVNSVPQNPSGFTVCHPRIINTTTTIITNQYVYGINGYVLLVIGDNLGIYSKSDFNGASYTPTAGLLRIIKL
jgi:hypothetical protein